MSIGIDAAPTGCNPNTATGDTPADHLVLSAVLPSAFAVDNLGAASYDPALIVQAELQSTNPQTVVYTINPRAVWSDGVSITAADFRYAWEQQRGEERHGALAPVRLVRRPFARRRGGGHRACHQERAVPG